MANFLTGALLALLVHELGHVAMAWLLGVRVKRVGISWRGPFIVREQGPPQSNACIALAGPGVNLALAVALYSSSPSLAEINLLLGFSQILPFKGSDGRRVWMAMRELRQAGIAATGSKGA